MLTSRILEGFRIQIPDEIVEEFNLSVGDIVQWEMKEDYVILHFVKKEDWEKQQQKN